MMQKLISGLVVILMLIGLSTVNADDSNKKKQAEELLILMGMNKNSEMMMSQIAKMQENIFASVTGSKEKDDVTKQFIDKMWKLIKKEMSWEKMKGDFIKIYSEVFTEEELKDLIMFYKSPVGMKYIEKTPELMLKTMEISQSRTQKLLPEIKKLIDESKKEKETKQKK